MTTHLPARPTRRHERLLSPVRVVLYLYPTRNPIYAEISQQFPPAGSQAVVRTLLVTGWAVAHDEITAWLTTCVGAPETPLPVPDLTRDAVPRLRYGLYLRESNLEQAAVIASWRTLPASVRQLVARLALVRGLAAPEIEERLRAIR